MGADLISICLIHPCGPVTEQQRAAALVRIEDLRKMCDVRPLNQDLIDIMTRMDLRLDPYQDMFVVEAVHEIRDLLQDTDAILGPLFDRTRDMVWRDWNGHRIYYAGELTWGDEPGGDGYQCLKLICELGLCSVLGFE